MHRRRLPVRSLALAAVGALALTACGGADATAPAASTDPTDEAATDDPADGADTDAPAADGADTPDEVTVAHAQGETTVPFDPQTVVTFDLGALDTLDALGVEVAGLPDTRLPERLSSYADDAYAKVGTLFEPDYEAVNALGPDLIIVGGRSAETLPELAQIAPTIDLSVDNTDFLTSFGDRLEVIGEIFGEQDRVADELAAIEARIEEVGTLGQQAGTGLILLTTGGEVSAYGPGSRFGLIHDELGVAPAAEDLSDAPHGDAVSFEFILEQDPDHLFVLDRDATIGESGDAAEVVLDNELVARTTAWQQGEVTYLDGFDWYIVPTGLRSVQNMIDTVEAAVS
ncbi:siderophore ABC transporter substrate-binding protein [Egicoccus halophilus]|uniref:Iron ABC transporter substrate-binding protein n=1 Tax=Egicoccus halophilus TaxID=1670830 RepID=A0A8J3ACZ6_9ACTN|nr:siderophore ABC transporter substrate-binding protein [Egicoccus halophilus]GGI09259.1 iron ABC transporter substrate-binding protein [Egicoccus halophilus]